MDGPLKLTTLKNAIKEQTGLRLEGSAAEMLAESINDRIARIVERAAVLVEMQGKSTLQQGDMEQALKEMEKPAGVGRAPEEVMGLLEEYSLTELGQLVELLKDSLEVGP